MKEIRILVFKLNGEYFATDIMEVERILGSIGTTKLPDSPSFLEGKRPLPFIKISPED